MLKKLVGFLLVGGTLAYPLLVYFSIETLSPRWIAIIIAGVLILDTLLQKRTQPTPYKLRLLAPILGVVVICLMSALFNQATLLLYIPTLIALNLFCSFGYSLLRPPSMVEVFARRMGVTEDFTHEQHHYCWQVTLIWVVFFVLNGTIAALTACCTDIGTWSLYNGLIAYLAMGTLFVAELIYRYWRFRRYVGLPTDALFRPFFPPRNMSNSECGFRNAE